MPRHLKLTKKGIRWKQTSKPENTGLLLTADVPTAASEYTLSFPNELDVTSNKKYMAVNSTGNISFETVSGGTLSNINYLLLDPPPPPTSNLAVVTADERIIVTWDPYEQIEAGFIDYQLPFARAMEVEAFKYDDPLTRLIPNETALATYIYQHSISESDSGFIEINANNISLGGIQPSLPNTVEGGNVQTFSRGIIFSNYTPLLGEGSLVYLNPSDYTTTLTPTSGYLPVYQYQLPYIANTNPTPIEVRVRYMNYNEKGSQNYYIANTTDLGNALQLPGGGPPDAPQNVVGTELSPISMRITWDPPFDNDIETAGNNALPLIQFYRITLIANTDPINQVRYPSTLSFSNTQSSLPSNTFINDISSLNPGTTYDILMQAKNTSNEDYGRFGNSSVTLSPPTAPSYMTSAVQTFDTSYDYSEVARSLDSPTEKRPFKKSLLPSYLDLPFNSSGCNDVRTFENAGETNSNTSLFIAQLVLADGSTTFNSQVNLSSFPFVSANGSYPSASDNLQITISDHRDFYSSSTENFQGFWQSADVKSRISSSILSGNTNPYDVFLRQRTLTGGLSYTDRGNQSASFFVDDLDGSPEVAQMSVDVNAVINEPTGNTAFYVNGVLGHAAGTTANITANVSNLMRNFLRTDYLLRTAFVDTEGNERGLELAETSNYANGSAIELRYSDDNSLVTAPASNNRLISLSNVVVFTDEDPLGGGDDTDGYESTWTYRDAVGSNHKEIGFRASSYNIDQSATGTANTIALIGNKYLYADVPSLVVHYRQQPEYYTLRTFVGNSENLPLPNNAPANVSLLQPNYGLLQNQEYPIVGQANLGVYTEDNFGTQLPLGNIDVKHDSELLLYGGYYRTPANVATLQQNLDLESNYANNTIDGLNYSYPNLEIYASQSNSTDYKYVCFRRRLTPTTPGNNTNGVGIDALRIRLDEGNGLGSFYSWDGSNWVGGDPNVRMYYRFVQDGFPDLVAPFTDSNSTTCWLNAQKRQRIGQVPELFIQNKSTVENFGTVINSFRGVTSTPNDRTCIIKSGYLQDLSCDIYVMIGFRSDADISFRACEVFTLPTLA